MTSEIRLANLYVALRRLGLRCLVMGGHAVRFYGIDRNTIDYDFHVAVSDAQWDGLLAALQRSPLLAPQTLREGATWRPRAFRRFVVGTLPDGREERLELWRTNHLLAPFGELESRRAEGTYGGETVAFLGIDDLVRSKETEREDDWRDVALLEEIADERRLVAARSGDPAAAVALLARLRSRKGFEQAAAAAFFARPDVVAQASTQVAGPLPAAFLAPFGAALAKDEHWPRSIADVLAGPLQRVTPASGRHLALIEAVRRLYRRAAMEADRADKEAAVHETG